MKKIFGILGLLIFLCLITGLLNSDVFLTDFNLRNLVRRVSLFSILSIGVTFVIFDVLSPDGESTTGAPYRERRALLESLHLAGRYWQTSPSFDDGTALFDAVCAQGLHRNIEQEL